VAIGAALSLLVQPPRLLGLFVLSQFVCVSVSVCKHNHSKRFIEQSLGLHFWGWSWSRSGSRNISSPIC